MSEPVKIDPPVSVPSTDAGVSAKIKEYNKASRLAKLSSIILEGLDFKISPEALREKPTDLRRELNVKTKIIHFGASDGDCVASIAWSIGIRRGRKNVAKCTARYVVFYRGFKDCSGDAVQMFIDNVGKTATYAYFRALYAQLDWSANLGSPPLPVLHIQPGAGQIKRAIEKSLQGDVEAAKRK